MLVELHCHTREHSSCSRVRASRLVRQLYERGLGGMALTDHHYLWPPAELERLRQKAEVPAGFLLVSGQEVHTREFGDVLVFGADRTLRRNSSLVRIRAEFPAAALVWAHPYRYGYRPTAEELLAPEWDAVEILNPHQAPEENACGRADWEALGFTAVAGSDIHRAEPPALFPTRFEQPQTSLEELAAAIRRGRCRPAETAAG